MPYKDIEKRRQRARRYYWAHREEVREYANQYCLVHRDETNERKRQYKLRHKSQGLCVECSNKAILGQKRCILHSWNHCIFRGELRRRWESEGRCRQCGILLMEEEGRYCVNCSMHRYRQYSYRLGRVYETNYETITSKP